MTRPGQLLRRCGRLVLGSGLAALLAAQTFVRSYGSRAKERACGVVMTEDRGFMLVGSIESVPGLAGLFVVRTDRRGDTLRTRVIADSGVARIVQAATGDGAGGVLAVGKARSTRADWDLYAARLDSSGSVVWTQTWGVSGWDDAAYGVCRTWDGGWAVCGYTLQRRQPDVSVARFAPDGTRLWSVVVGTALADYGYALAALPDGSLLVVGSTTPAGSRYSDVYLLKLDSTGQLRWSRTFGDSLWDEARAVVVMPDNGLAVAGFSSSYGVGMDCYLLRLDSTGQGLWFRTYGRDPSERAHGVAATAGGGIVLVGESEPAAGGSADAYVVRTDPEGGVVWERHWGGDGHDGASAVSVLDDRGLAIVGETESDSLSGPDFYFVRTDSLGGVGIELADRQDRDGRGSGRPTLLRGPIPVRPGGTRVFGADGRLVRSLGRSQTAWDGRDDAGRVVGAGLFCLLPADGAALRVVRVR